MITLEDVQTDFLVEELRHRGYLRVLWQKDDIEHAITEFGREPHENDINAIAEIIEKSFDASVGINWDVIGQHVYEYFNPQKEE